MAMNAENFQADNDDKENLDKKIVDKFYNHGFNLENDQNLEENFSDHLKNSRNQKIAIASVGVVGILIVVLWFIQMKGILAVPFPPSTGSGETDSSVAANSATDLSQLDAAVLKQQDTDGDGVSDFDELYIYNTSAYLADSDSDGTADGAEIKAGADPNCPAGHTCFQNGSVAAAVSSDNSTAGSGGSVSGAQINAAELRTLLIGSGKFTKEQIDQIDDKSLMDFYNNFLKENPQLNDSSQSEAAGATDAAANVPVTAADVRQSLLEQGMSADELSQIDDAALMRMYQEALEQARNGNNN